MNSDTKRDLYWSGVAALSVYVFIKGQRREKRLRNIEQAAFTAKSNTRRLVRYEQKREMDGNLEDGE